MTLTPEQIERACAACGIYPGLQSYRDVSDVLNFLANPSPLPPVREERDDPENAYAIADRLLDTPWSDPDDDIRVVCRQFLRQRDALNAAVGVLTPVRERAEAMAKAIEPFVPFGTFLSGKDDEIVYQFHDLKATVGDFRRAAQALANPSPPVRERAEATPLAVRKRARPPVTGVGTDENGCYTMPDGDCISQGPCMHTAPTVKERAEAMAEAIEELIAVSNDEGMEFAPSRGVEILEERKMGAWRTAREALAAYRSGL